MDASRKVTCFVTRGVGPSAELLVFWHSGSGIQVPAGTVEDDETFDEAGRREAAEETGLGGLELVQRLGSRTHDLPPSKAVLLRKVMLRTRPGDDAPQTKWPLYRVKVAVLARENGFARVSYEESDLDSGSGREPLVYARLEGWVPEDCLSRKQERWFYHFRSLEATPARWQVLENGEHDFHVYWVPLVPKPAVLIPPQQEWLDEFYADLLAAAQAR